MPSRFDLDAVALADLLPNEPRYRLSQLRQGLLDGLDPIEITTLPKALRGRLQEQPELRPGLLQAHRSESELGDTVKWLWQLDDGRRIETVLMHYPGRSTVCVSSQAGCAMACGFCATGQAGFDRQLTTGEILEQVVRAGAEARRAGRRLSNVVFMGMGEPLANLDAVWAAVERIHDEVGLSARHLTVSTVGIVPGIRRLARKALPVNLAVSLHAANDELRTELVPINRRYPLSELAGACQEYLDEKHRRLSFEWALIAGVNDRTADARELANYARPLGAHVNLIPLNPTPDYPMPGSSPEKVREFRDRLRVLGVNATVRQNRGTSIDAACGQLRAAHLRGEGEVRPVSLGAPRSRTSLQD